MFEMALRQLQLCPLCGHDIWEEPKRQFLIEVMLFGAVKYSICPHCLSDQRHLAEDKGWMRKVDGFYARKSKKIRKCAQVFSLIKSGSSFKEVAGVLNRGETTVRSQYKWASEFIFST